jgi:hypothetical protein
VQQPDNRGGHVTAYEQVTATPGQSAGTAETARNEAGAVAGTVRDEAANVTQTAGQAVSDVAGTATHQAGTVATEAKTQLSHLTSQAREQVSAQASVQKDKAATQVRTFADQLQSLARGEPADGPAADIVRQLSDKVQQLADKLEHTEPAQLLDEVRRYARTKPGTFLVGAAVAGFASGRLVKGATAEPTGSERYGVAGGTTRDPYRSGAEEGLTGYAREQYSGDPYGSEPLGGESYPTEPIGTGTAGGSFDAEQAYPSEPRRTSDTGGAI